MWSLLLAVALTVPHDRAVVVDRVEINTVVHDGRCAFTQIILWRWSSQRKQFLVAEWHLLPDGYRPATGGAIVWRSAKGTFRVKPKSMIFTQGSDPELAERNVISTESRVPYF